MKILVIGGSGFIGSHVADYFTSQNHQVAILDIKKSKWIQKSQKFTQGDITKFGAEFRFSYEGD